jgi:putative heme-binding domain-containing protein
VSKDVTIRRNAVWTLTRIGTPKAQGSVRLVGLADKDPSVLAAAAYSAGVTRDEAAVGDLTELLTAGDTPPQIVRQAATSLGQIGDASAVPAILQRLHSDADRVLEHALVYALIEIADRHATAKGLASDSPRVRRAALIALDQMPRGDLSRDEVAALLDTTDQPLLTAALDVISRREGWADQLVTIASKLLAQPQLSDSEQSLLSGALVGLAKNDKVQSLVAEHLARTDVPIVTRLLLLDVISRSDVHPLPEAWKQALFDIVRLRKDHSADLVIAAAETAGTTGTLIEDLLRISQFPETPRNLRVAMLAAVAPHLRIVETRDVDLLLAALADFRDLEARQRAVQALSTAPLSNLQQMVLAEHVANAGPLEMRALLDAFKQAKELEVGRKLMASIARSPGIGVLTDEDIERIASQFPRDDELSSMKLALYSVLPSSPTAADLRAIPRDLPTGGVESGKLVFHGRKAACATCHRVGSEGGKIGPDLSKVGERRNDRDLLEAVIVPSASIARGYESQTIRTTDGRTLTGLVVRETTESIFLRTSDQLEIRLRRSDIEEQKPSEVSIMPAGLENTMTRQELADLLAYLRSLK